MTRLSTSCGGRRPKSAKARSRGRFGTGGAAGAMGIFVRGVLVRGVRLRKFEEWRPRMRAQLKRFGTIVAKWGI